MGDHHQVKTSFLFIQLQSPSKACGPPHPADTVCSGSAAEEGLAPSPASDGHGSPATSSPVSAPRSHSDAVSDRSGEGRPESAVHPSATPTGDTASFAGGAQNQESLCSNPERSDVVCEDAGNPVLDTPVWILRRDTPESMSAEIGPLGAGLGVASPAAPSQPGAQGRVSFLHPGEGSGASHMTPDTAGVGCPPAPGAGADTAQWGEESCKQSRAICKSAESKTFHSTVIERSAKIPGEPYKKKVDRSSSMSSPGPENCAAAKPAPEPSPTASAELSPLTTAGLSPHLPPTPAEKVSLCFRCAVC